MTTPRIPPSPTKTLLPLPITNHGIRRRKQNRITSASSASLSTVTNASAGPPIFHDVYGASGSSKRARGRENRGSQLAAIRRVQQRAQRLRRRQAHAPTAAERITRSARRRRNRR